MKIREMSRDAEMKITTADDLDSFIEAEKDRKEEISRSILELARVVLCSGEIDKDVLHMLCEKSVLVVEGLDPSELRNASGATGAVDSGKPARYSGV